ncbi:MAG: transcriptional repressor [Caldilineaceae bacterium]|nr:transcriptional repressor [Caldilineaceae bacterium]
MAKKSTLIEILKRRGIRVTPQRAIILEVVERMQGHITAEDVYTAVQNINSYINLATIYRTLDLLKELDLIIEADMGTGATHYALRTHGTHHHAICRNCGYSFEFPHEFIEPLTVQLRKHYDFVADADHTVIFGWCKACIDAAPLSSNGSANTTQP